ncbi:hypothetical protein BDY17DRAFT_252116 [Neohortaea acidophila]|uniref:RRM domain-containing protein n=1 Tax=Neohortaea acidophila TaxID=245834 RepID=A0A6A6PRK7_9PEZI|nr:uncharacterized protein BDY17DRAFT_252116 [Neohortaea acidophila]KAF2482719.1 hypothetical protein BDY17DRAFT_252116 [Neohortaea acidophila]
MYFGAGARAGSAILIRRLSRNISSETLSGMLIFAGDLVDTEIVRSPYAEDEGYATAIARFQSQAGAIDAQQKLHGKPNTAKEANMIVEIHSAGVAGAYDRRNTIDGTASRTQTNSSSSATGPGGLRFNNSFQPPDQISPPLPTSSSGGSGELPMPETSAHFQNLFSPQSPLANGMDERHRMSGKYTINNDSADDETGELLKDPVAYAKSGQQPPLSRRTTNPQLPLSRFGNLSLSSSNPQSPPNLPSPLTTNGMKSPRSTQNLPPPLSPTSYSTMPYPRPQYPPVNPADQNPPCNTLYVGNLPLDTSEDELKALFSKQRGYKRLCFRTKQNGPMCFVEFEDVSFATKALHELYGHPLHNSVKGGIRLSFSKNPLGVRSGQQQVMNGLGLGGQVMNPLAMAPPGYAPVGNGGGAAPGGGGGAPFSAASGPPPGLASPPGLLHSAMPYRPSQQQASMHPASGTGMEGMFANPFGLPTTQDFTPAHHMGGGAARSPLNGPAGGLQFPTRDGRPGYTDYMLGR